MSSIKCPECGLVNFAGALVCKRCQQSLDAQSLDDASSNKRLGYASASSLESPGDSLNLSKRNSDRKLFGQVVGGTLIAIGLFLGLTVAINQDYSLLRYGGAALLIGAFVVVILTQPRYSKSWTQAVLAIRVGITFTVLGSSMVFYYGLWTPRTFVPLLGIVLIVLGVVAFRNRS